MSRDNNRAEMPLSAELVDEARARYPGAEIKVLWVSENGRELGRRPEIEKGLMWVDSVTVDLLRQHNAYHGKGKRR